MSQDSKHLSLPSPLPGTMWPASKLLLFSVGAEATTHKPHKLCICYLDQIYYRKSQTWPLACTTWTVILISFTKLSRSMKCSWTPVGLVFLFHFHTFLSLISTCQILSLAARALQIPPVQKQFYVFSTQPLFFLSSKINFYSVYNVKFKIWNQLFNKLKPNILQ